MPPLRTAWLTWWPITGSGSSNSKPSASRFAWQSLPQPSLPIVVKAIIGLRVSPEIETSGLDLAEHGEEGYHAQKAS